MGGRGGSENIHARKALRHVAGLAPELLTEGSAKLVEKVSEKSFQLDGNDNASETSVAVQMIGIVTCGILCDSSYRGSVI